MIGLRIWVLNMIMGWLWDDYGYQMYNVSVRYTYMIWWGIQSNMMGYGMISQEISWTMSTVSTFCRSGGPCHLIFFGAPWTCRLSWMKAHPKDAATGHSPVACRMLGCCQLGIWKRHGNSMESLWKWSEMWTWSGYIWMIFQWGRGFSRDRCLWVQVFVTVSVQRGVQRNSPRFECQPCRHFF